MADFIAYYRVSTDRQRAGGLGLDAQRQAVAGFLSTGQLVAEFTEIERRSPAYQPTAASRSSCGMPEEPRRIADCPPGSARPQRCVYFGSDGERHGFYCLRYADCNRLTIHILVAEHEREMISERTTAPLAEAKRRGTKFGNPRIEEARAGARHAHHVSRRAPAVSALMEGWRQQQWTLCRIAHELNRLNIRPARGRQWCASGVSNQLSVLLVTSKQSSIRLPFKPRWNPVSGAVMGYRRLLILPSVPRCQL